MMKLKVLVCVLLVAVAFGLTSAAAADKPIKIGAMFISSGKLGGYGINGQNAIKMAVEEINGSGGILGRKLEAVFGDTKLKTDVALGLAKKFLNEDKVDFLMGPTSSKLAMALTEVARKNKKILVVTQAATGALTGAKFNPYLFSTLSNAMMHARAGAYLMASKPYKKWMAVGPDYNYGHGSWKMFKEKLKELRPDVEFIGEAWPKLMAKDYTPFIKEVLAKKPDAVWCPLWGGDAVTFIKQALPMKLFDKVKFAFPCGGALEVLIPVGKQMPKGLIMSSRYFFTTPDCERNHKFAKAYKAKYGEYPDYMAGETYAGVYFLKAAIERAGSTDADKIIAAVEAHPFAWDTPEGWKIMRKQDHQAVEDVIWGETVLTDKYPFPVLKNIISIQPEQICRTPAELQAVMAIRKKEASK
ncbi:MAG: ABC transporter substrate-binding protein [Deltaproteobacteria bacterium]